MLAIPGRVRIFPLGMNQAPIQYPEIVLSPIGPL
jgi:hypothetical protein